jgi:hypothetical protein
VSEVPTVALPSPDKRHGTLEYEADDVLGEYIYVASIDSWTHRRRTATGENFVLLGRGRRPTLAQIKLWQETEKRLDNLLADSIRAVLPPPDRADLFDPRMLRLAQIRLERDGTVQVFLKAKDVDDAIGLAPQIIFGDWTLTCARWVP